MALIWPVAPDTGDTITDDDGRSWEWDGEKWKHIPGAGGGGGGGGDLKRAGFTMNPVDGIANTGINASNEDEPPTDHAIKVVNRGGEFSHDWDAEPLGPVAGLYAENVHKDPNYDNWWYYGAAISVKNKSESGHGIFIDHSDPDCWGVGLEVIANDTSTAAARFCEGRQFNTSPKRVMLCSNQGALYVYGTSNLYGSTTFALASNPITVSMIATAGAIGITVNKNASAISVDAPHMWLHVTGGNTIEGKSTIRFSSKPLGTFTNGPNADITYRGDGSFLIAKQDGSACDLTVTGDVTANGTLLTSDPALKTDIEFAPSGALAKVCELPVMDFRWRDRSDDQKLHRGFLATDVHRVMGEESGCSGDKSYSLSDMTAMLWRAVQELTAEVERLKKDRDDGSRGTLESQQA